LARWRKTERRCWPGVESARGLRRVFGVAVMAACTDGARVGEAEPCTCVRRILTAGTV
jgi:hypothetical protein